MAEGGKVMLLLAYDLEAIEYNQCFKNSLVDFRYFRISKLGKY